MTWWFLGMENEEKRAFKGDYLLHLLYGDTLSV